MAERRQIELEIQIGESNELLKEIVANLNDISDGLGDVKKDKKAVSEIGKEATKSVKGVKGLFKNLTSVGNLFKASGVFFVATKIFEALSEALRSNQAVLDAFSIAQGMATQAITDFGNFVFNNFGKVQEFFQAIFDDPLQSIKNFGKALFDNVVERVRSALDALGFLTGAMDDAKNAGKELVDTMTGVDGSFDKAVDGTKKIIKATTDYTKSIYKQSKAVVESNEEALRAEAINQGLIEKFDVLAEKQRQIRDNDMNNIDDRIKANQELSKILAEQLEVMEKNAQKVVRAAELKFEQTGLLEDEIALIQARNELSAVEARVTGQASEALTNENALRREKIDIMNNIKLMTSDEFETAKIEADEKLRLQIETIQREVKNEDERSTLIRQVRLAHKADMIAIDEAERQAKLGAAKQVMGDLQNVAEAFGKKSKGLAIASIIVEQVAAVSKIISNTQIANTKALAASPLTFGQPWVTINTITAVTGIASAVASAKKSIDALKGEKKTPMASANVSGPRAGGGGGIAQPNVESQAPAFNVVGASPVNQLAESINQNNQKPVRAYVISQEVSNQQALDRNIKQTASIG